LEIQTRNPPGKPWKNVDEVKQTKSLWLDFLCVCVHLFWGRSHCFCPAAAFAASAAVAEFVAVASCPFRFAVFLPFCLYFHLSCLSLPRLVFLSVVSARGQQANGVTAATIPTQLQVARITARRKERSQGE